MTDEKLMGLIRTRAAAWELLCETPGVLGGMSPAMRARADRGSAAYRSAGLGIVAELRRRGVPFVSGGASYRLTADCLGFVECDRRGKPSAACMWAGAKWKSFVHDYSKPIPALRRTA